MENKVWFLFRVPPSQNPVGREIISFFITFFVEILLSCKSFPFMVIIATISLIIDYIYNQQQKSKLSYLLTAFRFQQFFSQLL